MKKQILKQKAFEEKWHEKVVIPTDNSRFDLPKINYIVTAALYEYEDELFQTVFALRSIVDSPSEKARTYTLLFHFGADVDKILEENFTIVGEYEPSS